MAVVTPERLLELRDAYERAVDPEDCSPEAFHAAHYIAALETTHPAFATPAA